MSKECGSSSCRWRGKLYIAAEMKSRARSREGSAKMAILISFAQVASKLKIMLKHYDLASLLDLGASMARSQARRGSQICPFTRASPLQQFLASTSFGYQNVSSSIACVLRTTLGLSSSKSSVTFPPALCSKSSTIRFDASLAR